MAIARDLFSVFSLIAMTDYKYIFTASKWSSFYVWRRCRTL